MRELLFVEKVFLRPPSPPLRGVELFNFQLIRELQDLGYSVLLPMVKPWEPIVREELGMNFPGFIGIPDLGVPAISAMLGTRKIKKGSADWLIIGNVGKGIIPMVRRLHRKRCFKRSLVIAHRETEDHFLKMCQDLKTRVVAVNTVIAQRFAEGGCTHTVTDYGVMHAEKFFPGTEKNPHTVIFGVLGAMDNPWKGADRAIAAFKGLTGDTARRCRLELASYKSAQHFNDDRIKAHTWRPPSWIPGFLRRIDVLIVPSYDEEVMRETFSQAMVQGMLSGLPIIVNDLPVLVEKLDAGGGRVCADAWSMTSAMKELAEDAVLRERLGKESRKTALERYIWDTQRFVQRYLE